MFNDESISIFNSWESSPHLAHYTCLFERLWENRSESNIVIPIPEAIRRKLIEFAPEEPPVIRGQDRTRKVEFDRPSLVRDELWSAVGQAVANDPYTTIETSAAELWPHQLSFWRRYGRDTETPPRVLIADEVGLGKTIQAGAVLKTLINQGKADRVLILTPAVARWQWQQELRHKFNVEISVEIGVK